MTHLQVLTPGLFTQVQDSGRPGYAHLGVPASGPMDPVAFRLANALVGNISGEAALELTATGGRYVIGGGECVLCIGGDLPATLDGRPLAPWISHRLPAGSELALGNLRRGMRAYLAFAGGFDLVPVLGSSATLSRAGLGGWHGRALQKGDRLPLVSSTLPGQRQCDRRLLSSLYPQGPLAVIAGPQQDAFTARTLYDFCHSHYRISRQADRMGYRLSGAPLLHKHSADMVSDAVVAGSIQVPGNGQPIIALHDRQTTGGYPKIATVASVDLPRLGQMRPGQGFYFRLIDPREAVRRWRQLQQKLEQVLAGIAASDRPWS